MTTDDLMMGSWRDRGERSVLVERVIAAERRARVAETQLRALQDDRDTTAVLAARIAELEDIVERQQRTIVTLNRKAS